MGNATGIDFGADAAEMVADLYGTITSGSETVNASFGAVQREDDVAPEGVFNEQELTCFSKRTGWTTVPDIRGVVTVTDANLGLSAVQYTVIRREVGAGGVLLSLRRI